MSKSADFDVRVAEELMAAEVAAARAFYGEDAGGATALLPILHALQSRFGCVSPQALPLIAQRLNISQADVRGVVSFYHDFREQPAGRHLLQLCRAEACQARGVERIAMHLQAAHGLRPGETKDQVTLQNAYCLGLCAQGPAARVGERLWAELDEAKIDALIVQLRSLPP